MATNTSNRMENGVTYGWANEERFLFVMSQRTDQTPKWFCGVSRASPSADRKGIDAYVFYHHGNSEYRVKVPVQVKSSKASAKRFAETHQLLSRSGAIVIVVHDGRTDDAIRANLYARLGHLRNRGVTFQDVFHRLWPERRYAKQKAK